MTTRNSPRSSRWVPTDPPAVTGTTVSTTRAPAQAWSGEYCPDSSRDWYGFTSMPITASGSPVPRAAGSSSVWGSTGSGRLTCVVSSASRWLSPR